MELFLRTGRGAWHLAEALGYDSEAVAALRAARDARYLQLLDESELLIPGAVEAVRALRTRYRLAIVTSSEPEPFARAHGRTGILPAFELALTREQYGESKPHPEPYLRAVERLGVDPRRCLVIEDSERGLRAAKAAGLACWVIPSALTRGGRFEAADAVLANLGEATRPLMGEGLDGQPAPADAVCSRRWKPRAARAATAGGHPGVGALEPVAREVGGRTPFGRGRPDRRVPPLPCRRNAVLAHDVRRWRRGGAVHGLSPGRLGGPRGALHGRHHGRPRARLRFGRSVGRAPALLLCAAGRDPLRYPLPREARCWRRFLRRRRA